MRLPETPAGHDAEVREVAGQCVPGARPLLLNQSSDLEVGGSVLHNSTTSVALLKPSFCKANGEWHVLLDNGCECLPGYETASEENMCSSKSFVVAS